MKIVIVGASGHVGQTLANHWIGHEIIAIGRNSGVRWDGRTVGPWAEQLEGADLIVNLAGRSVNCRYTEPNLKEMMASRVESTQAIGDAVSRCKVPPRIWLQSSTATIYTHTFGDANGDDGVISGNELYSPRTWKSSVEIAKAWEAAFFSSEAPKTKKIALRSSMIMSPIRTSVFGILAKLARSGLGGRQGYTRSTSAERLTFLSRGKISTAR